MTMECCPRCGGRYDRLELHLQTHDPATAWLDDVDAEVSDRASRERDDWAS